MHRVREEQLSPPNFKVPYRSPPRSPARTTQLASPSKVSTRMHPSQVCMVIPTQVWFASTDGSMLLYEATAAISRMVLGVLSVGADHTSAGISYHTWDGLYV